MLRNWKNHDNNFINHENYCFNINNSDFEGKYSNEEIGDYQICFKGYIDEFNEISVGKGKGQYSGMYVNLNKSELKICRGIDNSVVSVYNHDMKFKDYISVVIVADLTAHADIEISTNGNNLFLEDVEWDGRMGALFVDSNGANKLSDCKISYVCNGWNKPIWLLGDSYFSLNDPTRWTSYLIKNGHDNFLLNGYPGRNSEMAMISLRHMLDYASPKAIVWCIGMNDTDTETSVNENWEQNITELVRICKEKDIELILATIPNCTTVNNKYKNKYVINSGFKYIDFSKAVGAEIDAGWYDSMLENVVDPVHPTETGAIALYNEAIATCPELLW